MATKLKRLVIDRVDLVDKGANQHAHVLLCKRDDNEPNADLVEAAEAAVEEAESLTKAGRKISSARMTRLKAALAALQAIISEGTEGEATMPDADVTKQLADLQAQVASLTAERDVTVVKAAQLADLQVQVAALTTERDTAIAKAAQLEQTIAKAAEPDEEDIWKGVHPKLRAQIEADRAEKDALQKRWQTSENARVQQECITKAAAFRNLAIKPDDDWTVFKALLSIPEKERNRLEEILRSGDEAAKQLLKAVGMDHVSHSGGGSAYEIAKARGQVLVDAKKADNVDDAVAMIWAQEPALYRQHRRETMSKKSWED